MKAWLVLQEGPGAGYSYPLDPFKQPLLSVGRSSECDVVLDDHRASRHHSDIRWNGRQWEVVDRSSTNGTYVNGMRVHRPYDLRLGDRVTIGETTLVLSEYSAQATAQPRPRSAEERVRTAEGSAARPRQPPPQPAPRVLSGTQGREHTSAGVTAAFWLVQGLTTAAVVCLATGAFLPWLKVTGSLSQDLQPLIQSLANIVAILSGPDSIFSITQEISGLEGYGKLTLGIAGVGTIALVVDIFSYGCRKSVVPGVVYLVSGLIAAGAMGFDLVNYYRFYKQMRDLSLLFGVQLTDVVQVFDQFIDVQVTPMIGLLLTGAGLVLLLVGGVSRLVVALLNRSE